MAITGIRKIYKSFIHTFPIIFLFFLAFTGFDFSFFLFKSNFSFNFIYIVIFYWVLKKPERLGYGLIFLVGIINDVVQNLPIGISSINYLLLCAIASFIRTRTLMPNLLYDWIFFFVSGGWLRRFLLSQGRSCAALCCRRPRDGCSDPEDG